MTNTCTKVLTLLYLALLKVLFAPIGLRTLCRPMFADVNLSNRVISLELAIAVSNYAHVIRALSELGDSHL